ncbi:hypothetical protein SteCoe_8002 [Stentor coeruleus]|uniref:DOMON domain-containing protein n=1 Tax=Stentor coeruleus TaxID=5963 RepID=A0A1R2CL55_9CILI|nr:hypothetical protein SteCoe_8002 [Stentor coeruleus]
MKIVLLIFWLASHVYAVETLSQKIDSVMTMEWTIEDTTWIKIRLLCQVQLGYCSIGLRSSMTNCDMFAAITDGTSVFLVDYWSRNHNTPKTDINEGGTEDIIYVSGGLNATGNIDVTFKRKLSTGDSYDQDILTDVKGNICWGYRNNRAGWTQHTSFGDAGFVWASTAANVYFQASNDSKKNHGIVMSIAWGCLAVIGIFACRYFKFSSLWIYIHSFFLLATSLLTIISSSVIFKDDAYPYSTLTDETNTHSRLGMILSSLVIAECIFGMLSSYFKIFTKNVQATTLINRLHKVVGYALLICGLINCWKGWVIYGDGLGKILTILGFIAAGALFVTFEIYQIFVRNGRRNPLRYIFSCTGNTTPGNLMDMTHLSAIEQVKNGKKLMFYDDLVLEVGHFALSHPGGSFMISNCYGEDTGKYMVGCSSYGGSLLPYTHSLKAFSYLTNLAIARIPYPEGYIINQTNEPQNLMQFMLATKIPLNEHTFLASFKSNEFKMSRTCLDPLWIGKHFMVCFKKGCCNVVKRYYSSVFVNVNEWAVELGLVGTSERNEDGLVKLIFKAYPGGAMTGHLNEIKAGQVVIMKGPLGPGLMLQSFEGNYMAFAGGTGLVPFLDLVYMAWKCLQKGQNFFLTLFVSFRTWKDGFALEILQKMQEIAENWFRVYLLTDESKDKENIPNIIIEGLKKGVTAAWICGPSGYNRHYADFLAKNGLDKNKIIVM